MITIASTEFNFKYGNQIFFPYTISSLVSYAKTNETIVESFEFLKTCIFRDKLDKYIETLVRDEVDILLCSCYMWNWEITTHLASEVKKRHPKCLIIFGGPQVPNNLGDFFDEHDYVDIVVHGEGEITLTDLLLMHLDKQEYHMVPGVETREGKGPPRERITDLSIIPSPYLSNTIIDLAEVDDKIKYVASWESNRGCPFGCTFCDWGAATQSKIVKRDIDTVYAEIEWFGRNKILYIGPCDANFGIFPDRDLKIAEAFRRCNEKYGFPERVRPTFAKASSDKIIPIAKALKDANLLRAVTLAVQSLDPAVLKNIKRSNIKFDKFSELVATFNEHDIDTYTEVILALPGETLPTFKEWMRELIAIYPRPSMFVYNCGIFVNAPMAQPGYMEQHGIQTIRSPIFLMHSSIHDRGIPEYEKIVVSSRTFTNNDLKEMYLFSWLILLFHNFGVLELVAYFYHKQHNMDYVAFYNTLIEYCKLTPDDLFGTQYANARKMADRGYAGQGWNDPDPELGEVMWPIEESSWLRIAYDSRFNLTKEMVSFIAYLEREHSIFSDETMTNNLVEFQMFMMSLPERKDDVVMNKFIYDWPTFFKGGELKRIVCQYEYDTQVTEPDPHTWNYQTIWYGRSSQKFKTDVQALRRH